MWAADAGPLRRPNVEAPRQRPSAALPDERGREAARRARTRAGRPGHLLASVERRSQPHGRGDPLLASRGSEPGGEPRREEGRGGDGDCDPAPTHAGTFVALGYSVFA